MSELDTLADQYLNYLLIEKGLSDKTLESYGSDMAMYLSFLEENKINNISDADTPVILKHLISMRNAGLGARSRARHLVTIRGFYRFMV
ncbi:MAG TPA: site-specific integrase, partial [Desulfobacterales bacterium]|nr:site-specific integrase [Desulfobacterales bacterium]